MPKIKFWSADKILSMSAFVLSLATLITLMYQTRLMQKQQYASVLPYLYIATSYPDEGGFSLFLNNKGVGPAFIQQLTIYYDGKSYAMDPATFLFQEIGKNDTVNFYYASVASGRVITAGEQVEMIGIRESVKDASMLKEIFWEKTELEVVYTSIYGETWKVKGIGSIPEAIE